MALGEKLYTAEEFFEIASQPENQEKRLELEDGEIVDMGSSRRINTITGMRIGYFLSAYVVPNNLGYITGPDGGFQLSSTRVRRPDVGFISKSHNITLDGVEFDVAPDLAVEVVSPDEDIFKKALEYLHAGTRMVWAVYTDDKIVYVMRLDDDGSLRSTPFGIDTVLDGGDLLPGFSMPVKDIFPDTL